MTCSTTLYWTSQISYPWTPSCQTSQYFDVKLELSLTCSGSGVLTGFKFLVSLPWINGGTEHFIQLCPIEPFINSNYNSLCQFVSMSFLCCRCFNIFQNCCSKMKFKIVFKRLKEINTFNVAKKRRSPSKHPLCDKLDHVAKWIRHQALDLLSQVTFTEKHLGDKVL